MDCQACGSPTIVYAVPEEYRQSLPEPVPGAATCTECLALQPVENPPSGTPDFQRISDAFPSDAAAGLPMALAVGLLSSLALNRSEIASLFEAVEHAGTDPMLVVDRLLEDRSLSPHVDLGARRRQLEQLT